MLQTVDIGLLISTPEYDQRKRYLEWYYAKKSGRMPGELTELA